MYVRCSTVSSLYSEPVNIPAAWAFFIQTTISTDTSIFAVNEKFFTYLHADSINGLKSIIIVDKSIPEIIETCSPTFS